MSRRRGHKVRLLAAGLILAASAGALAAGPPLRLTAEEAVALALGQNPALKAVEERRSEVRGGILEARADAFPQLSLVSFWARSRNPSLLNSPDFKEFVENFPGGTFRPREQELQRLSLEVTQPIFTWGKVGAAVQLAREVADVAEARIDTARLDTALAAAEGFYDWVAAQRALDALEIQRRARQESLEVVEARFEEGEATRLELLRSRSQLAGLLPEVEEVKGRVEVAASRLRSVLDLPADTPLEAAGNGEPSALERPLPGREELLALATERRPELRDLSLQGQVLGSRRKVTRADGRPQVELDGRYGRESRRLEDLSDSLFDEWSVSVGLSWDFFDGGRRRGQIAQLESQQRQLGWEMRELESRIVLEVDEALSNLRASQARWSASELAAQAAREATRVAEDTYREGVALQSDWIDAQEAETEAELRRVDAYYETLILRARLARAVGVLPAELAGLEEPGATDAEGS